MAKIIVSSQTPIPSMVSSHQGVFSPSLTVDSQKKEKEKGDTLLDPTLKQIWKLGEKLLTSCGVTSARLDMRLLLEHNLGMSRLDLELNPEKKIAKEALLQVLLTLSRRLCFEPLAYIVGKKEFFSRDFFVDSRCLIPRPDSECVVEACLERLPKGQESLVVDACTGSGALGLTLLHERPKLSLIATDISKDALLVAEKNARSQGLLPRVRFIHTDLLAGIKSEGRLVDLIVSNPPYIPSQDIALLSRDIKDFEPGLALDAHDSQGISFYRRLLCDAKPLLKRAGFLITEIGFGQEHLVRALADNDWLIVETIFDLSGTARALVFERL
jgi:release factor glutamine methyltransferase